MTKIQLYARKCRHLGSFCQSDDPFSESVTTPNQQGLRETKARHSSFNLLQMRIILLTFLLTISTLSFTQKNSIVSDTLDHKSQNEKLMRFVFSFDSRNSFVANDRAKVFGIRIGYQYRKNFRNGLALYSLNDDLPRSITINKGKANEQHIEGNLDFGYLAFFWEQIWFKNKKWEISTPMQTGFGSSQISYTDPVDSVKVEAQKGGIMIIEPTAYAEYQALNWLAVGIGTGFRVALVNNDLLDENLNSPIYALRVKVQFGQIVRGIKKKKADRNSKKEKNSSG